MKNEPRFEDMLENHLPQHFPGINIIGDVKYSKEYLFEDLFTQSRIIPSKICHKCSGADNSKNKNAYSSAYHAHLAATLCYEQRGTYLEVYKCRYGSGWHLTKAIV